MPLVKVNMLAGKTPEFKKTLFDCIHEGLIDAFEIADWDRFQRIEEFDKTNWEAPEGKTENFMIIELTIFPGRSREQKKNVIEKITACSAKSLAFPQPMFLL